MEYAIFKNEEGRIIRRIALRPANWGAPYRSLFNQTDVSGWEVWLAYSHHNFKNPFRHADEGRYRGRGWWTEIFRDVVRSGARGEDHSGRLHLNYISHAGTEWESEFDVRWPQSGYWVPTEDGIFVPGTLVPFETVKDRKEAVRRLKARGIPPEHVSYAYRLDRYQDDRFVCRRFILGSRGYGRFGVDASWPSSCCSDDLAASRPGYPQYAWGEQHVMAILLAGAAWAGKPALSVGPAPSGSGTP